MGSFSSTRVVFLLACIVVTDGSPSSQLKLDTFTVLPALLNPQMMERFEHETHGYSPRPCGHWCDSEVASMRQRIAEQLHLPASQLGDLTLEETAQIDPSLHPSWHGAAIAYVSKPDQIHATMFINEGSKTDLGINMDHGSLLGSVVVVSSVSKAIFQSQVKLMVIPVLRRPRQALDYYILSGLAEAFVSSNVSGSFLGLDFFRSHTRYPVFWHAFVWSALGSAVLALLGMPLILRAMHYLVEAMARRIETRIPQQTNMSFKPPYMLLEMAV